MDTLTPDRDYVETNRASLERLQAFIDGASDEELARPMSDGWTVASILAHMAFWDLRVVVCVDAWRPDGSGPVPTYDDDAVDWMNDATKPLFLALEPRTAARVCADAAEAADRRVAELSDELLARNQAAGLLVNPDRADHRLEHLDELERALGRG